MSLVTKIAVGYGIALLIYIVLRLGAIPYVVHLIERAMKYFSRDL